ncbi:YdiU family protein [uncultured Deefgea sp.]|uniref:protein adenylyltransferase SelO n=1 Tax=uncultured Deefgea sp. TaxID=1304914 RepID=UPI0025973F73|nr:YdiU family protein [uncultured Deefgea sp.]
MPTQLGQLPPARRFQALGTSFYCATPTTPMANANVVAWNAPLAATLGLSAQKEQVHLADYLVGNQTPQDCTPIASVYAGHQFGINAGQLGDGRAVITAELTDPQQQVWEVQLKGAGPTPYSRRGDGRAVLRSTIREYLCCEAMHGLGIPTTRALGIGGSPQPIWRETRETAAVLTRLAPTFVRFGHFEHQYYRNNIEALQQLADWTLQYHYPECQAAAQPYLAMFAQIIEKTAHTIAQWQAVGFCHGVMNSDNMSILGLTLDYGPFGFLDGFNPGHICNHSDDTGRYAYQQQPQIGLWNLHCLGQALLPLIAKTDLLAALSQYQAQFETAFAEQLRQKLGLTLWHEEDWTLVTDLFELLQGAQTDWTYFWRTLSHWMAQQNDAPLHDLILDRTGFAAWLTRYRTRLALDPQSNLARSRAMLNCNPKFILRNHLAEIAIRQAEDQGDMSEIERLRACLAQPFDEQIENEPYAHLPPDWASTLSVSCSS